MHVEFQLVPPRRKPGRRSRMRGAGQHLRAFVVLEGRRKVHLACATLPLKERGAEVLLARCESRLLERASPTKTELRRLMGKIKRRVRRELADTRRQIRLHRAARRQIMENRP
jgi:hypothetical protein